MALFKGDVLIAGTNPSGGGGTGGGYIIEDSEGTELEQRPVLQFIGADIVDDDTNEVTKVITPSFREIQGDIPDTNLVCLDGIPIGGIIPYGAPIDTLSQDWLPCLGQAVSRTFYHELFAKYGTTYGTGDGSTTFNLPNYGGRVPVGLDENDTDFDTLGETLGEKRHTLTIQEMPSHTHSVKFDQSANGGIVWLKSGGNSGGPYYSTDFIQSTGGGQAHNNIQPSIVANYIVKAKTSSHTITTSNVMTVHNESDENTYSTNYINDNFQQVNNLTTGGRAVRTGRMIDGQYEYVKRFKFTRTQSGDQTLSQDFGMSTSIIEVIRFDGNAYSNSKNNFDPAQGDSSGGQTYNNRAWLSESNDKINLLISGNFTWVTINVYFIFKL